MLLGAVGLVTAVGVIASFLPRVLSPRLLSVRLPPAAGVEAGRAYGRRCVRLGWGTPAG